MIQKPKPVCPGKESAAEALEVLRSNSEKAVSLKANGQCLLEYYAEGKKRRENFPVKIWANLPDQVRIQAEVFFDARGIDLGSNGQQFWFAIKPRKISTYRWGLWSEQRSSEAIMIGPKLLFEALGVIEIDDERNWSLSKEEAFDVLTKVDKRRTITKKIYMSNCDYRVRKIEYFDVKGKAVVTELDRYRQVVDGFDVATVIKIVGCVAGDREDSVRISLGSVKLASFSERQKSRLFTRPEPRGFEHVYKIIDGKTIEQQQ